MARGGSAAMKPSKKPRMASLPRWTVASPKETGVVVVVAQYGVQPLLVAKGLQVAADDALGVA
jgi:hypothetical protein